MKRIIILLVVLALHAAAFFTVTITTAARQEREDTTVFKLVDVTELQPPPPIEPPPPEDAPPPDDAIAEEVIETDEPVPEPVDEPVVREPVAVRRDVEIEYLPQHLVSVPPGISVEEVRSQVRYPPLAQRQGIEGVVYLELYIDDEGRIRRVEVLRDPGYGLGEAAIQAFEGLSATPAYANGEPVAVRFRYPVRFSLR
ncbi:MAG: TonB family protein [Spirochaetales bacterium]|nr:TonB family protein [Spirochaetales bacterium]